MPDDLRAKTVSGFGWALSGQLSNQVLSFVISVVLARLLTPEEFGLASLVLVVNLIGQIFIDAGITSGLIRKRTINNTELSSFFYLNIMVGVFIMLLVVLTSTYIAKLFESENLAPLLQLSSLQFFISSVGMIPMVFLKRDINFKFLTQLEVSINVVSGVITIILAFLGFGVYSLIFRSIISGILNVGFLWRKVTWRPSWVFSFASMKPTLSYSTGILGLNIINTVSGNLSTILIGKVFSVSTIGIYNRAANTRGLILKNFGPLFQKVFFPVLSKIQDDEARLQSYYLKAIQLVSLLTVFAMAILFLFSNTLIYYLYGKQWMASAPMLQVLSLAGLVLPISSINLNLFMVKGQTRFLMRYELCKHFFSALIMIIAIGFGMDIFLYSLVGIAYLFFFMNVILTNKKFNFPIKPQLMAFLSKLLPALILVLPIEFLVLPKGVSLAYVLMVAPIFTILYFGIVFLIDRELYGLVNTMVRPKLIQAMHKISGLFSKE